SLRWLIHECDLPGPPGPSNEIGTRPLEEIREERRRSVRARRVKDDLIVFPELLHELARRFFTSRCRSTPHDLVDRVLAVDCGEGSLLRRIDRQGEVGEGMCPIYQNGRKTGRHPVANTQDPRQVDGNVAAPGIAVEGNRLA